MPTKKKLRRLGHQPKHGAQALVFRKEIIEQYPELVRYARECRDGLIRDLAPEGEDTLSTAKQIVLDRLQSKLLTAGLLDIFLGKNGVIRRDRLDQRVLEAEPCVQTWLQVNHAILRDLQALGLERVELGPRNVTPDQMLLDAHADVVAQEAAKDAEVEDKAHGAGSAGQNDPQNTADRLAKEHGVSPATIKRDGDA